MSTEAEPTLDRCRRFIDSAGWRFAKTMPDAHEYTVRGKATAGVEPPPTADHDWFVREIRRTGYRDKWGRWTYSYLEVDGWKYWAIGRIINREHIAS